MRICTFLFLLILPFCLFSQGTKGNLSFEEKSFVNWIGKTGTCCPINLVKEGIVTGRHTLITNNNGTDPRTGGGLRLLPIGETIVAKLGNEEVGAEAEALIYKMKIDESNALLMWKFAVVLQDPQHDQSAQPRFQISIRDLDGNVLNECTEYLVISAANITGFQSFGEVRWRNWTTTALDLSPYIGQTVSIEFQTGDCMQSGHYGYAYFIAKAQPLELVTSFCSNSSSARLVAPEGFVSYKWSNGEVTKDIEIDNPVENTNYECVMETVTGCIVTVRTILKINKLVPDFIVSSVCGEAFFEDRSTTDRWAIVGYKWNFGDQEPLSTQNSPSHKYARGGKYTASLEIESVSGCKETIYKEVSIDTFAQVSIEGSSVICKGDTILLTATGANFYKWSTGETGSQIRLTSDTMMTITLIGYDNNACVDSITKQIDLLLPPEVTIFGCDQVCANDMCELFVEGNYEYTWQGGERGDKLKIMVDKDTLVSVTGVDKFGCKVNASKYIFPNDLPQISIVAPPFVCSGDEIEIRALGDYDFYWLNGQSGNIIKDRPLVTTKYKVLAANKNGCRDTASVVVDVRTKPIVLPRCQPCEFEFGRNTEIVFWADINNQEQPNDDFYFWDFGDGYTGEGVRTNHSYYYSENKNEYIVSLRIVTPEACEDIKTIKIVPKINIPNTFTPNADGINDVFMPDVFLQVFDRLGTLLYKGKNGWDGTYQGRVVKSDTYYYVIQQNNDSYTGFVTILK